MLYVPQVDETAAASLLERRIGADMAEQMV
jgi:hypothetical protein